MALETKNNTDLVQNFVNLSTELYKYTCSDNMIGNSNFDTKLSAKLGKQIDKIVKTIINSQEQLNDFISLLESNNLLVAYLAAEYLYPLFPKKCIKIMKLFYCKLEDKIDKYTVKTKIEGLTSQEKFFIDTYKKLYNTENLELLNRENKGKHK